MPDKPLTIQDFLNKIGLSHFLADLRDQARVETLEHLMEAYTKGCMGKIEVPPAQNWILEFLLDKIRDHLLQLPNKDQALRPVSWAHCKQDVS